MIGSDCCVGLDCCFRKLVQCLCLHVHSVLLHSWFGIRAFIAIRRFALGIQINQGRLGQLGNALHPMLSTIDNRDMRMACFRLQCRCTPGVSPPGDIWRGRGLVTNTRAPCSWRRWWHLVIILQHGADMRDPKSLQLSPRSGRVMLGKQSVQEGIDFQYLYMIASAFLRASIMSVRVANRSMDIV